MIDGKSYLERGQPVTVICGWKHTAAAPSAHILWTAPPSRYGPRNVYIERADGLRVVRPFRGMRRREGAAA